MSSINKALLLSFACAVLFSGADSINDPPNTGMADPVALINAFDRFLAGVPATGGTHILVMPLVALRGLTSESMSAGGNVTIDLTAGSIVSQVRGLPADGVFDLWLARNRAAPGHTTMAEPRDLLIRIGAYQVQTGRHRLSVTLGGDSFATMLPDRAFVVRSNQSPLNSFVLTGSNTIFDRLMRRQVRFIDVPGADLGFDPVAPAIRGANFARLIAQGRQLFVKEQFNGNGRTCGTCHVESHNFTIDPEFISTLRQAIHCLWPRPIPRWPPISRNPT